MPNSVFYILIALVIGTFVYNSYRRKRLMMASLPEGVRGARQGPVPGYTYLPGVGVQWDPNNIPQGLDNTWEPVSIETLHAGARSRIVLTVRGAELDPLERYSVMKTLVQRIQQRSRAMVVAAQFVGVGAESTPEAVLIYAPDGRGWTGTTTGAVYTADLPDRQPFRLSA